MEFYGRVVLCALFGLASSIPHYIDNGVPCLNTSVIDYDYQANIITEEQDCGGAIVSTSYVLTLASCLRGVTISKIVIRAGYTRLGASSVIFHPQAFEHASEFDAALIKLSEDLKTYKYISPINLANKDPEQGTKISVSTFNHNMYLPEDVFLYVSIGYTKPISSCFNAAWGICASAATCVCDIGNPLVTVNQKQLVGLLLNDRYNCAIMSSTVRFVSVAPISGWVKDVIKSK